jgi:hypothetical protein
MAYASARRPISIDIKVILAKTPGNTATSPYSRKNNHKHQPEIVLGIDIFISHSPLELKIGWPNYQPN